MQQDLKKMLVAGATVLALGAGLVGATQLTPSTTTPAMVTTDQAKSAQNTQVEQSGGEQPEALDAPEQDEQNGAADTDNVQDGDQNGPEGPENSGK